jgi:centromeric protein E
MSSNALPRRTVAPPTGPLPSLPVPKARSLHTSPAGLRTPSSGSSGLPSPSGRANSYSTSPRPGTGKHITSPSVPTMAAQHQAATGPPTGKSLRKVVSIGAFPQPPKHSLRTPSSPLATSASSIDGDSMDQRVSTGSKASIPSRKSSLKKPRASNIGGPRGLLPKSPLSPPSFLNGNGSAESVAIDTSHLNLPSPPQSRNTSPQGSRSTSATTIEEGDDEARGRKSSKTDAESSAKGNVLVSVRVRPDVGPKDGQQDKDWDVSGKRHTVTYHGRDGGGDYIYGKHANRSSRWSSAL